MLQFAHRVSRILSNNKDAIEAVQSIITSLGLLAGGVWAYLAFGRRREKFPRMRPTHRFHVVGLENGDRVLRVDFEMENIGDTLIEVRSVLNRLQQVLPVPHTGEGVFEPNTSNADPEISWPMIDQREVKFASGQREIEPKESDTLHFDYVLGPEIEVVLLYSYVHNAKKKRGFLSYKKPKEIGWMKTEILRLGELDDSMKTTQNAQQLETRQGTPKPAPMQTASGGAAKGQGVAKPAPVKVTPKSN